MLRDRVHTTDKCIVFAPDLASRVGVDWMSDSEPSYRQNGRNHSCNAGGEKIRLTSVKLSRRSGIVDK